MKHNFVKLIIPQLGDVCNVLILEETSFSASKVWFVGKLQFCCSYIWLRHALNKTILWLADHLSIKAESEESVFTRILRLEKENKHLQALVSTYKDAVKSSEITEVRKLWFICNFQMHVEPQQT